MSECDCDVCRGIRPIDWRARALAAEAALDAERAERAGMESWDGLMRLLDRVAPEDIFPTAEDSLTRDPGPRLASALRLLDAERKAHEETRRKLDGERVRTNALRQIQANADALRAEAVRSVVIQCERKRDEDRAHTAALTEQIQAAEKRAEAAERERDALLSDRRDWKERVERDAYLAEQARAEKAERDCDEAQAALVGLRAKVLREAADEANEPTEAETPYAARRKIVERLRALADEAEKTR